MTNSTAQQSSNSQQANIPQGNNLITQEFTFKEFMTGTSKKTGKPFYMVQLHDFVTLENMNFFLQPDSNVSTNGINFKDKVRASFSMQFQFGELKPVLQSIVKI